MIGWKNVRLNCPTRLSSPLQPANSLGGEGIESFDLVVTDLNTHERLGVLHTFGTLDSAAALFPSMAIAPTPGQFQRIRRCPSIEKTVEFMRKVASP